MIDIIVILFFLNFFIGSFSLMFISYIFFKLTHSDRQETTLHLKQLFDKFKRYDILKSTLILLVFTHYFIFLGRIVIHFNFSRIFFEVFILFSSFVLIIIDYKLLKILKFVPHK